MDNDSPGVTTYFFILKQFKAQTVSADRLAH